MYKALVVLSILLLSSVVVAQEVSMSLEPDTNRPGMDYRNFDLEIPEPELCQQACERDEKCRAFTYVKPGIHAPKARCWLKSGVPAAKPGTCCVSGVKRIVAPRIQTMEKVTEISPKPTSSTGTSGSPSANSHPSIQQPNLKEVRLNIPSVSARQAVKPKTRAELVNLLLANPRTAPQLNQIASTMGMPAQELATRSSSGKKITGGPVTAPPSGATKSWNWEAGVRFTPRSTQGNMQIYGVTILQGKGNEYGLSDMCHRDELLLYGNSNEVRISFSVPTPPGKYIITVELETQLGFDDDLTYNCYGCRSYAGLLPVVDEKAMTDQAISRYIGQFEVGNTNMTTHSIRIPQTLPIIQTVTGVFRGITFTRL